jgi:hypothetical protein
VHRLPVDQGRVVIGQEEPSCRAGGGSHGRATYERARNRCCQK